MAEKALALRVEELRDALAYDPETGLFHWKVSRSAWAKAGTVAGSLNNHGYTKIMFKRRMHAAHRLAWFYVYGEWPAHQIDHINGDRTDNRLINLRVADNKQNQENIGLRSNNTTGFRGVSFNKKSKMYEAHIRHNGKKICLGMFFSAKVAAEAARKARQDFFTHNART